MKLTLIISKLLNLKEENILGVTNDLIKDHDLKNDLKDPSFSLFERAAEVSKTDFKCLTAKRA